ncbi:hypothetical protein SNE25_26140 [Mucilaginibacter sabulilitoris]|uniref:Uncharacterized protein n=1 Tax=Mucilaginibacter sabulilitoris TaxID=1173583 RepID=A0ABZ0TM45_9SPHI|nr:hypothetical protein [Mucilaginibacter sabulilitoris]WPU92809.1 hypothetical protein SNE25_26140 [Mucilaginibacter sabulilitoris]
MILSDTYTFNAAMEYQGQNIGTELASEELCRELVNMFILQHSPVSPPGCIRFKSFAYLNFPLPTLSYPLSFIAGKSNTVKKNTTLQVP